MTIAACGARFGHLLAFHLENNLVPTVSERMLIPSTIAMLGLMAVCWSSIIPTAAAQPGIVQRASDYEDCVEQAHASGSPKEAIVATVSACDSRFPGRRKPGGGYTYFDFMQNRHFDIAGPVPTKKELKQIDHAFIRYLANRNGSRASAAPSQVMQSAPGDQAKSRAPARRTSQPRTAKPATASRHATTPHAAKFDNCRDPSLTCGWTHLTMQIKALKDSLLRPPSKDVLISRLQRRDR